MMKYKRFHQQIKEILNAKIKLSKQLYKVVNERNPKILLKRKEDWVIIIIN